MAEEFEREVSVAEVAARRAGDILLGWMGRFAVEFKGANDPVTQADRESQAAVRQILTVAFPDDGFLGEEVEEGSPGVSGSSGRRWIVDPLDGTANYVHAFPFFCVSIGLWSGATPLVAVLFDPLHEDMFIACRAGGATLNGQRLGVSENSRLADSLIGFGLPSHPEAQVRTLPALARLMVGSQSMRRLGSSALSLAYVAAGRLDAFWGATLHPWDAAAGVLLIREAGGRVTHSDLSPYTLDRLDVLASNGRVHHEIAHIFAENQASSPV